MNQSPVSTADYVISLLLASYHFLVSPLDVLICGLYEKTKPNGIPTLCRLLPDGQSKGYRLSKNQAAVLVDALAETYGPSIAADIREASRRFPGIAALALYGERLKPVIQVSQRPIEMLRIADVDATWLIKLLNQGGVDGISIQDIRTLFAEGDVIGVVQLLEEIK